VLVALAYTVRLPFRQSLLAGLTISVADVAALAFAAGPAQERWVGVCYLLGINAAGWVSAHRAEAMLRQQFLDHVVLQGEHRELIGLSRRLERLSMRDELTGLGNRRELSERLGGELAAAARSGVPLTLALIDLDRFKEVNDGLGHAAGDELLRQVAQQLGQLVRQSDAIFRLGGDEFCVVMPATTGLGGRQMIERTLAKLQEAVAPPLGGTVEVGFSAGCAASRPADTIADLLERADAELYRAKRAGRGKVCSEEVPLQLRAG
jgi:diguanylate cyclase (GGDEF)-like protein